jgi:hypothetical protein
LRSRGHEGDQGIPNCLLHRALRRPIERHVVDHGPNNHATAKQRDPHVTLEDVDREVAYILWQMANEYQAKAARVDGEALIHSRDEITIAH